MLFLEDSTLCFLFFILQGPHMDEPCQLVLPRVPGFSCRWAPNGLQKSVCPYPVDSESHSPAAVSVLPFVLKTQHLPHPNLW